MSYRRREDAYAEYIANNREVTVFQSSFEPDPGSVLRRVQSETVRGSGPVGNTTDILHYLSPRLPISQL
jgi:hypothetical protein